MNLDCFSTFGDSLAARYKESDRRHFGEIAQEALNTFDFDFRWSGPTFANFLSNSLVPQQPNLTFSNFPLTVYSHRDFYIELLTWTQGTTTIHQHSFSGAFKVLLGSSIHSLYEFTKHFSITSDLLRGNVEHISSEYLSEGDVRQITPGTEGLTHRLFHLEKPSVTLVIRTHGEEAYLPQYRLMEPCFAYNEQKYQNDSLVIMLRKLILVTDTIDHGQALEIFLAQADSLDFPRLLNLYFAVYPSFTNDHKELSEFYDRLRLRHGQLADDLVEASTRHGRLKRLLKTRNITDDPEIRFFLALLLNMPDRTSILRLVQERYPDKCPQQLCAKWMYTLSLQKEQLALQFAKLASQTEAANYHLGARLRSAVSDLPNEELQRQFFETLFTNQSVRGFSHNNAGLESLKNMDEFLPIFR